MGDGCDVQENVEWARRVECGQRVGIQSTDVDEVKDSVHDDMGGGIESAKRRGQCDCERVESAGE